MRERESERVREREIRTQPERGVGVHVCKRETIIFGAQEEARERKREDIEAEMLCGYACMHVGM